MKNLRIMDNGESQEEINEFIQFTNGEIKNYYPVVIEYEGTINDRYVRKITNMVTSAFRRKEFICNRMESYEGVGYVRGGKLRTLLKDPGNHFEFRSEKLCKSLSTLKYTKNDIIYFCTNNSFPAKKVSFEKMIDSCITYTMESGYYKSDHYIRFSWDM